MHPWHRTLWHGADYNHEQWLDRPDILEADFEAMKLAGCNVMTVGIFSWSTYQPRDGVWNFDWMDRLLDRLHANGLAAILATPSGSKPAWLSKAHPEVCRVDVHGQREPHGGRHNHCRTSPEYRQRVADVNARLATRYRGHPALQLWHVSNEYGAGRCYCRFCLAAFREWLVARYESLETLNAAWWTDFWSHRFDSWDEIYPADSSLNALMLDWARFTSDQTIDFYRAEIEPLRRLTPEVPITTNFMQPDVGLDYFQFAREVDVVSWDSYPRWQVEDDRVVAARTAFYHDLFRSTKGQSFLLMESTPSQTNWQGVSALKRPGMHELASLQAVAHGSDSVQYFQWRQSRGGEEKFHGAVLDHSGLTSRRTFGDVRAVGSMLGQLSHLAASPSENRVAVVYDFENAWALDLAQLPRSLEKSYQAECVAWHTALGRHGVGTDVVDSGHDWGKYSLIVVPMLYLIRPGVVQRLEEWVANGGTLIVTYLSGLVDRSDLAFPGGAPGPLAKILGLHVEETDSLTARTPQGIEYNGAVYPCTHYADLLGLTGAQTVGTYQHDFYAGTPALTVNQTGKGRAWYVGSRLGPDFLDTFVEDRLREAELPLVAVGPLPEGIEVCQRGASQGEHVVVLNWNADPVEIANLRNHASMTLPGRSWSLLTPPPLTP